MICIEENNISLDKVCVSVWMFDWVSLWLDTSPAWAPLTPCTLPWLNKGRVTTLHLLWSTEVSGRYQTNEAGLDSSSLVSWDLPFQKVNLLKWYLCYLAGISFLLYFSVCDNLSFNLLLTSLYRYKGYSFCAIQIQFNLFNKNRFHPIISSLSFRLLVITLLRPNLCGWEMFEIKLNKNVYSGESWD